MEAPRRGCLYWVSLDKRRPALVLSPDYRNEHASDVIVVPCSTRLRPAPTHIMLRRGQGGLDEASVLKCEQITTLPRADVHGRPLGKPLPRTVLGAVELAVLRAIGVPVPLEPLIDWRRSRVDCSSFRESWQQLREDGRSGAGNLQP